MTRMLGVLEDLGNWHGTEHPRVDGSPPMIDRGRSIEMFNRPDSPALSLSVRTGGIGLNLQSADTVILYDTD